MSGRDSRQPPRFVPTLTDVVQEAVHVPPAANSVEYVLAQTPVLGAEEAAFAGQSAQTAQSANEPDWAQTAQAIQSKVMERIDADLEERLRYALSDMVQLHTQALYQAIRQDVEDLVRTSVHEAIAQELALMRDTQNRDDPEGGA